MRSGLPLHSFRLFAKFSRGLLVLLAGIAMLANPASADDRASAQAKSPAAPIAADMRLALGPPVSGPVLSRRGCAFCQRTREPATDFPAIDHSHGGPSRILLMRHADKTDDPDNEDLSDAGQARAAKLATYIPQTFGKPDYIIATARSKHSNRPRETVAPLADALGEAVEHDFENDEFEDLADEIFSDPAYKGKTLVICWHHGKLPAIAALLGAQPGAYPDPWPDDAYNLILDFRYDPNSGAAPTVSQVVEPF